MRKKTDILSTQLLQGKDEQSCSLPQVIFLPPAKRQTISVFMTVNRSLYIKDAYTLFGYNPSTWNLSRLQKLSTFQQMDCLKELSLSTRRRNLYLTCCNGLLRCVVCQHLKQLGFFFSFESGERGRTRVSRKMLFFFKFLCDFPGLFYFIILKINMIICFMLH